MGNKQYVISNADRATADPFTVPGDEDGGEGDVSFDVQDDRLGDGFDSYVHIDNGWDTNVDVTLRGTHFLDEQMNNPAPDGAAITVASGSVDFFSITSNHAYIDVNVNPGATPTSGDLTLTFQSRET